MQVMHKGISDDLLGDFSHISVVEGCFWLSVTNLVTIGYGSIVRRFHQHSQQNLKEQHSQPLSCCACMQWKALGLRKVVWRLPCTPPAHHTMTISDAMQSPSTRVGYTLCTVEHFAGLMMSSCLLGIVFARASIPTAKMAFSKVCLITTRCAQVVTTFGMTFQL